MLAGLAGPWRLDWLLLYELCRYLVQPVWAVLWLILAAVHAVVLGVMLGVLSSRGTGGGG